MADRAATDFLAPISEKRGSESWRSKNAEAILSEAGADLTKVCAKIAQDENLGPHEVARLCEEANRETFSRLYKDSEDKTFEFKVADADEILKVLDTPYDGPGDLFLPVEHPMFGNFDASPNKLQSNSWARSALYPSEGQKFAMEVEEEQIVKQAFTEGLIESEAAKNQAALDFLKTARELALDEGFALSDLYAMILDARKDSPAHEKNARELLALVALDTGKKFPEGAADVVKIANIVLDHRNLDMPSEDLRKDEHRFYEFWAKSPGQPTSAFVEPVSSAGEPVRILNGNHKLFTTLDSLVDQTHKENWYGKGLLFSGDRVRTAVRKVVNWSPKSENVS